MAGYFNQFVRGPGWPWSTNGHTDAWASNFCADIVSANGRNGLIGVNHPFHGQDRIRYYATSQTWRQYFFLSGGSWWSDYDLEMLVEMEYRGPETAWNWQWVGTIKFLHLDPYAWTVPTYQIFDWGSIGYQRDNGTYGGAYPLYFSQNATPSNIYSDGPHTHTATKANTSGGWSADWWSAASPYVFEWSYFKN